MQNIFLITIKISNRNISKSSPITIISVKLNNTSKYPIDHRTRPQRKLTDTLNRMKMKKHIPQAVG